MMPLWNQHPMRRKLLLDWTSPPSHASLGMLYLSGEGEYKKNLHKEIDELFELMFMVMKRDDVKPTLKKELFECMFMVMKCDAVKPTLKKPYMMFCDLNEKIIFDNDDEFLRQGGAQVSMSSTTILNY